MKKKILVLMLVTAMLLPALVFPVAAAGQIKIEAEDYTSSSAPLLITNNTELSNSKYVRIYEYPSPNGYTIGYQFEIDKAGIYEVKAVGSDLDKVYTTDWTVYMNDPSSGTAEAKLVEAIDVPSAENVFKRFSFGTFKLKRGLNTLYVTVDTTDLQSQDMAVTYLDYFTIEQPNNGVFSIAALSFRDSDSGTFTKDEDIILNIDFAGIAPEETVFRLKIEDAWQRTVFDREVTVGKGMDTMPVNLGKFAPGWYRIFSYEKDGDIPLNSYTAFAVTQPLSARGSFEDTAFASDLAAEYDSGTMKRAADYAEAMKLAGFDWIRSRGTGKAVTPEELNMKKQIHDRGIQTVEVMNSAVGYVNDESDIQFQNDLYTTSYQFWKDYPKYEKGYIDMVEVFNELDISKTSPTADLYAAYFKAAAIGLADSQENPYVSATGLAMYSGLYFDLLMQNGALDYSNVYNFHAHADLEKRVGAARDYSNAYSDGATVPLYLTEAGIYQIPEDGDTLSNAQMREAARYGITSAMISLMNGTDKHFWFLGRPFIENNGNYSAFHAWSYYPYPVYAALANMTYQLGEGIYKGEMANLPEGVYGGLFDDGQGGDVAVYWADRQNYVTVPAERVTYVDMYGYEEVKSSADGGVRISVSPDPVFIRFDGRCDIDGYYPVSYQKNIITKNSFETNERVVLQPLWQEVNTTDNASKNLGYSLDTNRNYDINVVVYNLNDQSVSVTLGAELSQSQHFDISIEPAQFTLTPWGQTTVTVHLHATGAAKPGQEGELKIFGALDDGTEISPAVSAYTFSMRNAVLNEANIEPFEGALDVSNWDLTNIHESGTITFAADEAEETFTMDTLFTVDAPWYFPKLKIEDNSVMADANGITFQRKCSADSAADLTSVFIYMNDGREYWSGEASAVPFSDEWETLTFPWSTFSLYKSPLGNVDIREFSTDKIEYVAIGVSKGTKDKPATTIKDFGVYKGFDPGTEINEGKIVLTGVEQNKKYQPGEVQNLSAQLPDMEIVKIKVLNGNTEFKNWERESNGNVSVDLSELGRGKHTISVCAQNRMNYWYISKITFYIE